MKIIADNTIPTCKNCQETFAEISYISPEEFTHDRIKTPMQSIIRSIDKCTQQILEGTSNKAYNDCYHWFDHIDTAYCDKAGIAWAMPRMQCGFRCSICVGISYYVIYPQ